MRGTPVDDDDNVLAEDHPRACGEHPYFRGVTLGSGGSSPRMRGTPIGIAPRVSPDGIIPAHAGNTPHARRIFHCLQDHPRACGEHPATTILHDNPAGIIPAHAGNTYNSICFLSIDRDHPRACGEHYMYGVNSTVMPWIIPAHAGNTSETSPLPNNSGDHPRACGEHSVLLKICMNGAGSSPRMRGTRNARAWTGARGGIIPAHAGNTRCSTAPRSCARDHPRACGEHNMVSPPSPRRTGSSPRMRGTRGKIEGHALCRGIIPAHAGNTASRPTHDRSSGDHPRACGEHCPRTL